MATYKIKNKTSGFIPGVGEIKNGIITTDKKLEGAEYELVADAAAPQPHAPQVATPTQPITNTQTENK